MQIFPNHILYHAYRHHSIGNLYAIKFHDFRGMYVMGYCGEDINGDHLVGLIDLCTGKQWTEPTCVKDPENITDSELKEILDPDCHGVEFVNCGPMTSMEFFIPEGTCVQST